MVRALGDRARHDLLRRRAGEAQHRERFAAQVPVNRGRRRPDPRCVPLRERAPELLLDDVAPDADQVIGDAAQPPAEPVGRRGAEPRADARRAREQQVFGPVCEGRLHDTSTWTSTFTSTST